MYQHESVAAYRAADTDGETQIGLLIAAYELLASHLRRAGDATERADVQARCTASNRAQDLLGHLESWVQYLDDPELQANLTNLYAIIRQQIVVFQGSRSRVDLDSLTDLVLALRGTWQTKKEHLLLVQSKLRALHTSPDEGINTVFDESRLCTWSA